MRGAGRMMAGVAVSLACAGAAVAAADAGTLVVRADGFGVGRGEVKVAVCQESLDEAGCTKGTSRRPQAAAETFVFEGLAPGRYAVAVYHDLNGNGELDKIPPGLPTEPYGFSNDVGRLGPPRFAPAAVEVGAEETVVTVHVRPLLGGTSRDGASGGSEG